MRNRPVKLNPKLTVLLYVLTRRGGSDRIARATAVLSAPLFLPLRNLPPSPLSPSSLSLRGGTAGEVSANARNLGFGIRGNYMRIAAESCRVELFPTTGHDR